MNDDSLQAIITSFARAHPEVRMQVDFSSRLVDLLREGYDVALRASIELPPGLVARTIRRDKVIAVASPEYLAKNGIPRTLKDLRKHRCVTGFTRGELPQSEWRIGRGVVHVESVLSSNDVRLLREAAVAGIGIALLPTLLLADAIETGALVQVLPGLVETESHIAVVFPEREFLASHVRAFIDVLLEWSPALPPAQGTKPAAPRRRQRHRSG